MYATLTVGFALAGLGLLGAVCVVQTLATRTTTPTCAISALSTLLHDLDDIEDAVRAHRKNTAAPLTRAALQRLLHEATGREVTTQEADLLFRVFDFNQDDSLSFEEFLSAARRRTRDSRWRGGASLLGDGWRLLRRSKGEQEAETRRASRFTSSL